jgi:cysteine dioxygenase
MSKGEQQIATSRSSIDRTPPSSSTATAEDPVPVPKDLDDLVRLLHIELGVNGLDSKEVDVARVQKLMASYTSNQADWQKYAMFDKGRYTRNLVDDGNGKFNLMILAWPETIGRYVKKSINLHSYTLTPKYKCKHKDKK